MLRSRLAVAVAGLIALHVSLCIASMARKTYTYDERNHYRFGVKTLRGDLHEPSLQRMPVTALNVLPAWARAKLGGPRYDFSHVDPRSVFISRVPTVLASALLAFGVFLFARLLYGSRASWLALTLYAFDPNVLAHARLATNDLYAAASILFAVASFWFFVHRPRALTFVLSAVVTGVAQLCKQTAILLLPAFALLWLWHGMKSPERRLGTTLAASVGYLGIVVLVVNLGYGFVGSFQPMASYALDSTPLDGVASLWPSWLPVPLPRAYLRMTAIGMQINATGMHHAPIYLFGRLDPLGWWYYFPLAFALKVPLALLGLFGWAAVEGVGSKRRKAASYLLLPALAIFLFMTFLTTAQIGVRYLLPVLPLMHVFISSLVADSEKRASSPRFVMLALLVGWYVGSALSFHPHYLGYANELIGHRKNLYRYLADSNVDWGQNGWYLERYLERNAGEPISVEPESAVTGKIVVPVNELVGLGSPERYAWLREHYEPVDHIGYSWLIFEVPDVTPDPPPP